MLVIVAVITLGLVCLSLLAALVYREREGAKERASLADRIQAPEVAQMVAMEKAAIQLPPVSIPPDPYDERVEPSDDVRLAALIHGEDA